MIPSGDPVVLLLLLVYDAATIQLLLLLLVVVRCNGDEMSMVYCVIKFGWLS
jgi:hypothetical protein